MSTDLFPDFLSDCPIGCSALITLSDGEKISGTLLSINTSARSVKVKVDDGEERFSFEDVKKWKKLLTKEHYPIPSPSQIVPSPPEPVSFVDKQASVLNQPVVEAMPNLAIPKNDRDKTKAERVQRDYREILNLATMTFCGDNDLIALPEPVFILPEDVIEQQRMRKTDIEAIRNKGNSQYNAAIKNRDGAKLLEVIRAIKEIESRYDKYRICVLPQLCGLLLLKENPQKNLIAAYDYLKKSLDWNQDAPLSLKGFIFAAMRQRKWREAAECILLLLDKRESIGQEDEPWVKALGRCLLYVEGSVPGLLSLKEKIHLEQDYFKYLLFLSVSKDSQEAAILAYEKKYAEAKNTVPHSAAWQSISMLYKDEPLHVPVPELGNFPQTDNSDLLTGTVIFYPDRQCGFINNTIRNESFYFASSAIVDVTLQTALASGITRDLRDIRVMFEDTGYRPWNQTWNQAKNVNFASEQDRQRVLEKISIRPRKKETSIEDRLKAIPKDNSPYAKAKRAEQLGNFEIHEHELSKVIAAGRVNPTPRASSAVLDLASSYNRHGRTDEALKLLDEQERILFTPNDKDRLDNVRISILTKGKRYEDAKKLLETMIKRTSRSNEKRYALLLQQKAFCLMMIAYQARDEKSFLEKIGLIEQKFQGFKDPHAIDALKNVKNMPQKLEELLNPSNAGMSDEDVQETIGENVFSEIDEINLPEVAKFLIENNKLENVDQRVRDILKDLSYLSDTNRHAIRQEVYRLRMQLDVGGRRPEQKGLVRLSLATLFYMIPALRNVDEIKTNLSFAFSFMGEACIYEYEREPARVFLFAEMECPSKMNMVALGMLILSYLQSIPESKEILAEQTKAQFFDYALSLLAKDEDACQHLAKDFPYLMCRFEEKSKQLLTLIRTKRKGFLEQYFIGDFDVRHREEKRRLRQEKERLETLKNSKYPTTSILAEYYVTLRSLANDAVFTLDKERLERLADIADRLPEIEREQNFLLADREIGVVLTAITNLNDEIEKRPTSLCLQHLKPLLGVVEVKIDDLRRTKQEKSAPQVDVINLLQDDNYTVEPNGQILLQLKVGLRTGSAPIENIEVKIETSEGIDFDPATGISDEQLRDGDSRVLTVGLIPSDAHIAAEAFDVKLSVGYRIITTGETCETEKTSFPIRIGTPGDPIINPFDVSRQAVSDPKKFVGRQEVISEVVHQVTQTDPGKCYVLFGQMRSGKSSTMRQMQGRIVKPCLAVYTDAAAGESEGARSMNFSLMIRDSLRKALSFALFGKEMDLSLLKEFKEYFSDESVLNSPVQSFSTMVEYAKAKLVASGWNDPRIVLLIDEFTYIYQNIVCGKIDGSIMKHWKAMLQNGGFSAVLVGQDTMPWFLAQFANEFGVIDKKRISYLSKEETFQMADGWILLPDGRSRYRDTALEKLFEYTAGNPFYTQRFCHTLVEYLNKRKASVITEADIDTTSFLLCRGGDGFDKIESSDFHPFYFPLDKERFTEEQYIEILRQIATETKRRGQATAQNITVAGLTQEEIEYIVDELVRREILEKEPRSDEVKIWVKLYSEYLLNNR